ncbi:342_t:CDS:2 [Acaulospora colombiana]|uniref:342_t:CDS:1 n=1 Tax=Acaulospora colombiana TaxID=27376 RepID=A0ACA9K578_9GLOM|nr:342_t:CDS:2 [Acaulospora colombiana]
MSQRNKVKFASEPSPSSTEFAPIHTSGSVAKFHPVPHTLITLAQLTLSTLCLFYFPPAKLLDDPVGCLNVTTTLLIVVQLFSEISRWMLYLRGDGVETARNMRVMSRKYTGENDILHDGSDSCRSMVGGDSHTIGLGQTMAGMANFLRDWRLYRTSDWKHYIITCMLFW